MNRWKHPEPQWLYQIDIYYADYDYWAMTFRQKWQAALAHWVINKGMGWTAVKRYW